MRVLVTGSRYYTDRDKIYKVLDSFHRNKIITEVIEGGAKGADFIAGRWAMENNVPLKVVLAQWNKYGKAAGVMRNDEMLEMNPDIVFSFHEDISKSKGTKHCMDAAHRKKYTIFSYT